MLSHDPHDIYNVVADRRAFATQSTTPPATPIMATPTPSRRTPEEQAHTLLVEANRLVELGSFELAMDAYQESLRIYPTGSAHYHMGNIYFQMGTFAVWRGGGSMTTPVTHNHPTAPVTDSPHPLTTTRLLLSLTHLTHSLYREGSKSDAKQSWQRSIELEPMHADVHVNLGNLELSEGNLEEAIGCYEKALEWSPEEDGEILFNLAVALDRKGDLDRAISVYQRARQALVDQHTAATTTTTATTDAESTEDQAPQQTPPYLEVLDRMLRNAQARAIKK